MRTDRRSNPSGAGRKSDGEVDEAGSRSSTANRDGSERNRLSRRAFVLAASTALGASTIGTARGTNREATRRVDVAATGPYRSTASDIASSARATDVDVRVRSSSADPLEQLRDGDADVHVSGRPTLSADDPPVDTVGGVAISGWAALAHDETEWRECLSDRELRDHWTGSGPVVTWSETDWESVAAVDRTTGTERDPDGVEPELDPVNGEPAVLVRGVRSYQYARGFGGVGYYGVNEDTIEEDLDLRRAERESYTPVVKLGYLHVDRSSLAERVETSLRSYGRRGRSDEIRHYGESTAKAASEPRE